MIKVDISNVWGDLSLPDMLAAEQEVFNAHKLLAEGKGPGNDFLGWLNLPTFEETEELRRSDAMDTVSRVHVFARSHVHAGVHAHITYLSTRPLLMTGLRHW